METEAKPAAPRDGFLRIALEDLLAVRLVHLVSGLDEDDPSQVRRCGTITSIMGYTEWVSEGMAEPVSLGWDWRLDRLQTGEANCMRVGLPRSNVMLIDSAKRDYGWDRNLQVLASIVDAIPWAGETRAAIERRTITT
ncbi:hypothetical protein HNP55_003710 [Paucibacter oligotrophus]|uniref:DUF4902 domain-containing protein n=1 Tax=Roseateles oligotrophus TaxID=1769250 RepID=A0A840L9A7_9BURK|nr:hypothetical protein [Roseateles oligotrophus]